MDHLRFKSEQTAAAYVAGGLDPAVRDEFELHLMSCRECVDEVESWRALKSCLPPATAPARESGHGTAEGTRAAAADAAAPQPVHAAVPAAGRPAGESAAAASRSPSRPAAAIAPFPRAAAAGPAAARWRLAAALVAGVGVGVVGGWYGRSVHGLSVQTNSIGVYSLPPLTRGPSDCTAVRIDPQMSLLAVRIPAAAREQQLVPVDSEGHDLAPESYSVRTQADGSWLVRLRADVARDQGIRFEARSADGTVEPRGCILNGPSS